MTTGPATNCRKCGRLIPPASPAGCCPACLADRKFTPDADTVALYYFDEGRGNRITDTSGHEHHGTIRIPFWVRLP